MPLDNFKDDFVFEARHPDQDDSNYIAGLLAHLTTVVERAKGDGRNHFILCYTGGISNQTSLERFQRDAALRIQSTLGRKGGDDRIPPMLKAKDITSKYYSVAAHNRINADRRQTLLSRYFTRSVRYSNHVCITGFRYVLETGHYPYALSDFLAAAENTLQKRESQTEPFVIVAFLRGVSQASERIDKLQEVFTLHHVPFNLSKLLSRIKTEELLANAQQTKMTLLQASRDGTPSDTNKFQNALTFFDTLQDKLYAILDDTKNSERTEILPDAPLWLSVFQSRNIPKYDPKKYRGRSQEFFMHFYRGYVSDSDDFPPLESHEDLVDLGFKQSDLRYYDPKLRDTLRKATIDPSGGFSSFEELVPPGKAGRESILSMT